MERVCTCTSSSLDFWYLQNSLEVSHGTLAILLLYKIFFEFTKVLTIKHLWMICVWQFLNTTHNLLTKFHIEKLPFSLFLFFQLPDMVWSFNLHWKCLITYEIDRWCLQLDDVFCLKRFLVRTLHIRHVIKVLVLSIVSFYQGLALAQPSIPFHMNGMNGNISDNGYSNEKAKKKIRVLIFKNLGGNIPRRNFPGGINQGGIDWQEMSWWEFS